MTDADVADESGRVTALKLAAGRAPASWPCTRSRCPRRGRSTRPRRRRSAGPTSTWRRPRRSATNAVLPVMCGQVRTRHAGRGGVDEADAGGSEVIAARLARAARRRGRAPLRGEPWTTRCATQPARSWSGRRPSGAGRAGRRRPGGSWGTARPAPAADHGPVGLLVIIGIAAVVTEPPSRAARAPRCATSSASGSSPRACWVYVLGRRMERPATCTGFWRPQGAASRRPPALVG